MAKVAATKSDDAIFVRNERHPAAVFATKEKNRRAGEAPHGPRWR